jgi:hypothetical protein
MASPPRITQHGDCLFFDYLHQYVTLQLDRWREIRQDLWCELSVRCYAPGYPQDLLHQGRWNLCSISSREEIARLLKRRYDKADWPDIIEGTARRALEIRRQLPPVIRLNEVETPDQVAWRLEGWIPEHGVTLLFGDGGIAKSTLGLAIAACVESGQPFLGIPVVQGHVLYLDYETDSRVMARRLRAIARGFDMTPPAVHYLSGTRPLVDWADDLKTLCAREGVQFLILDSLGYAGAALNEAEPVIATYRALQNLRLPVLAIHHVAKHAGGTTPYGSVYHRNSARSAIEMRREEDASRDRLVVGWFDSKLNDGKPQRPLGIELRYVGDALNLVRADIRGVPGLADRLPTSTKIRAALERQPLRPEEIREETGLPQGTVRSTLKRMASRGEIMRLDSGKYALLDRKHDE